MPHTTQLNKNVFSGGSNTELVLAKVTSMSYKHVGIKSTYQKCVLTYLKNR